eukprot:3799549-Rhodomonas_salina.3
MTGLANALRKCWHAIARSRRLRVGSDGKQYVSCTSDGTATKSRLAAGVGALHCRRLSVEIQVADDFFRIHIVVV